MNNIYGIDFINKILCDDIRQEKNNKFILIGVYPDNIVVTNFPVQLSLSIYVEAFYKQTGTHNLHFKIIGPAGEIGGFAIGVNIAFPDRVMAFHSPRMDCVFDQAGEFRIDVSSNGEQWETLIKRNIEQGHVEGLIPIVSELPA